jgi:hypothetical protein
VPACRKACTSAAIIGSTRDLSLAANEQQDCTHEITRHLANRESTTSGPQRGAETELVVPPHQLPTFGKCEGLVRGFALDAAAAPFVDVSGGWTVGGMGSRALNPAEVHHSSLA